MVRRGSEFGVWGGSFPKGSYVVPFWVCYGFVLTDVNIIKGTT